MTQRARSVQYYTQRDLQSLATISGVVRRKDSARRPTNHGEVLTALLQDYRQDAVPPGDGEIVAVAGAGNTGARMKSEPVRVLVVDDEPAHAAVIERAFRDAWPAAVLSTVDSLQGYRERVAAEPPDIAIVDLNLPDGRAVEVLTSPPEAGSFPILVLTSYGTEEIAVEVMKAGALDYVVKSADAFAGLPRTVDRALREWRTLVERRRAESDLARNYQTQAAMNDLLRLAAADLRTTELLGGALDLLLSLDWLAIESRAAVFLADEQAQVLRMHVHRGCSADLVSMCSTVPYGRCLCGRAAATRTVLFADGPDGRHDHRHDGFAAHGHYCVPILSGDHLLGVFSLYVTEGHVRDAREEEFLTAVAHTLASTMERNRASEALRESEARYRDLAENLNDVVFTANAQALITYISPVVEQILGFAVAELVGQPVARFVHPDDWPWVQERIVAALSGDIAAAEFRVADKSGDVRWVSSSSRPVYDADQAVGIQGILSDITERKRAENALRESEKRYRVFIDSLADMAFVKDDQLRYLMVNAANVAFFGKAESEITGRSDSDLMPPELADTCRASDLAAIESGGVIVGMETAGDRTYETRKFPVTLASGAVGVGGIVRDMTEYRQAQTEIMRLNGDLERRIRERTAELEASNEELNAFAYSVSHDLRAPLRAVDGFGEILVHDHGDQLDAEGLRIVGVMRSGSRQMAQLIDALLDLSRVTRAELSRTSVDLSAVARSVADGMQRAEPDRSVEFTIADGLVAGADMSLARVVLDNLLRNAWKYSSKTEHAHIEFGVTDGVGPPEFYVRDNGAGFDMRYAGTLFGAFKRLHRADEFEGTGIGLAIVQRIVRRHGGTIRAEAEVGKGATFYFTFGG